jgi:hypothetical protein
MPAQNLKTKTINELKYEGLAALIVQGQEAAKERHDTFVKYAEQEFDELKVYNKKQNGSISEAMRDIAALQKESIERKLTCAVAVDALTKKSKYTNWLFWIDTHFKASMFIFIATLLLSMAIIHTIAQYDLFFKAWLFVKQIM